MTGDRIEFVGTDAAVFHARRDQWREVAAGAKLPKVAHKIASLLPNFLNRESGYCWPTDLQLAERIRCDLRTVGKAMHALTEAGLIERDTEFRQGATREANGKHRRIWLTLPSERPNPAKGATGPPEVNGPKQASERPTGGRIYLTVIPDSILEAMNEDARGLARVPNKAPASPFAPPPDEATGLAILSELQVFPFDYPALLSAWYAGTLTHPTVLASIPNCLEAICRESPTVLSRLMSGQIRRAEIVGMAA